MYETERDYLSSDSVIKIENEDFRFQFYTLYSCKGLLWKGEWLYRKLGGHNSEIVHHILVYSLFDIAVCVTKHVSIQLILWDCAICA